MESFNFGRLATWMKLKKEQIYRCYVFVRVWGLVPGNSNNVLWLILIFTFVSNAIVHDCSIRYFDCSIRVS